MFANKAKAYPSGTPFRCLGYTHATYRPD